MLLTCRIPEDRNEPGAGDASTVVHFSEDDQAALNCLCPLLYGQLMWLLRGGVGVFVGRWKAVSSSLFGSEVSVTYALMVWECEQ